MGNFSNLLPKNIKDSYINSPRFIPTKSILERRISGNLKPSPSIKHVRGVYGLVSNLIGKTTTVRQMKYAKSWKNTAHKPSNVKY